MSANPKTVLIVDDDKITLATYKLAFIEHGHHVLLAENGNVAIKHLEAGHVDLVLLDILMPEKDGIETLLEIRKRFSKTTVFVMTGAEHDFLTEAARFGATGVMRKPITPPELITLLDCCPGPAATNRRPPQ